MSQKQIDILQRALQREKEARKAAEKILEEKSRVLYHTSQKQEQLLDEKSSQLQGVFENIVDAYVVIDLKGNVLKFNESASLLFDYDINVEDVNMINLIYPEDISYAMSSFRTLRDKGFFKNYETRILNKSKDVKWVHINGSIVYNKKKKAIAAQGIVRDITELKFLEIQKEKLLLEVEKSNIELQEYAHIVSHDLKSPLRSIDALVNWIKEDNKSHFNATTLEHFGLIESTLEKMEHLISDVLNYSSVGADNSENTNVDLSQLIIDVKYLLFIPDHITVRVNDSLPIIYGDKTKLQQLFQNLISNAIKFIDKEKGLVEINYEEQKDYYLFSIKDNGIGIDEKFHNKIFKIFHALNKSITSTGIGLSIVKKIVKLYDGSVWLESTPGIGTIFYFTLKK
ncbi:ATP-binding protein [Aurantibacter sp.]|uniref:sensor histidine kinase n=1 Tax=Aurantibacter sp. TaxID=2807103 RepID=UPI0035C82BDE